MFIIVNKYTKTPATALGSVGNSFFKQDKCFKHSLAYNLNDSEYQLIKLLII